MFNEDEATDANEHNTPEDFSALADNNTHHAADHHANGDRGFLFSATLTVSCMLTRFFMLTEVLAFLP